MTDGGDTFLEFAESVMVEAAELDPYLRIPVWPSGPSWRELPEPEDGAA